MSLKLICVFLPFLLLSSRQLPAQTADDLLLSEHESVKKLALPHRNGFAAFDLKLLVNGEQKTAFSDSSWADLRPDCMGDLNYPVYRQLYRAYEESAGVSIDYVTYERSNWLSFSINDVYYEIGNADFLNSPGKNLIDGLEFSYTYGNKPLKVLRLRVTETIPLQLNENSRAYQEVVKKEGKRSRDAKALRKPVFLLPGSTFTFFIY